MADGDRTYSSNEMEALFARRLVEHQRRQDESAQRKEFADLKAQISALDEKFNVLERVNAAVARIAQDRQALGLDRLTHEEMGLFPDMVWFYRDGRRDAARHRTLWERSGKWIAAGCALVLAFMSVYNGFWIPHTATPALPQPAPTLAPPPRATPTVGP